MKSRARTKKELRYFMCERQSTAIAVLQDLRMHIGTDVKSESKLQGRRRTTLFFCSKQIRRFLTVLRGDVAHTTFLSPHSVVTGRQAETLA